MSTDSAHILVVEDESGMRNVLAANLEDQGYRVTACRGSKEALGFISQTPPDVVIADLRLSDGSGLQILEAFKEINPEGAFILMTGFATLETAVEALNEGAFAYITKPFDMDQLHGIVRNALRQQRLLVENRKLVERLQQSNAELSTEVAERQRAEEALLLRTQELEALFTMAATLDGPGSFEEKATRVLEELAQVAQGDSAILRIPDEDGQGLRLVAWAGRVYRESPPLPLRPYGGTLPGAAFQQGQPVVVNAYAAYPQATQLALGRGLKSLVAVPIEAGGSTLGTISVGSVKPNHFTPNRIRLVTAIGAGLGTFLENSRLNAEAQRLIEENEIVAEVARIISSNLDIDRVFEQFAAEVKKLVDFDRIVIHVIDRASGTDILRYHSGLTQPGRYAGEVRPLAGTATQYVVETGQKLVRGDIVDNRFATDAGYLTLGLRSSIVLPLVSKGQVMGTLSLRARQPDAYSPQEVALLERLANQLAPAVTNAQLYEQRLRAQEALRLRTQELEALFTMAATLDGPGSFEEKATRVLHEMAQIAQADLATLRVPHEEEQGLHLMAAAGPAGWQRPPVLSFERGLTSVAFQQGEPVVANDYAAHPRAESSAVAQGTKSSVFLPIKASGRTLGVMDVLSKEINHFTPERVRLLTAISEELGVLLENSRLNAEAQRLTQENEIVAEVARIISSNLDIDRVFEQFAAEVKKLVDFDRIVINIVDYDAGVFVFKHVSGLTQPERHAGDIVPLEGTQTQHVMLTGRTLIREDVATDPRFRGDQTFLRTGFRSTILVPLVSKGVVIGTMSLRSRRVGAYGPREQRVLERLTSHIAPALANAQLYEQRRRAERALTEQTVALARVEEVERSRQRIIAAQEGVRRDIAAHLHGRVQGRLLVLKGRLQEFLRGASLPDQTVQALEEVVIGMDQVIQEELGVLSRQLYPSILRLGLVPALQSLGDRFDGALEVEMSLDEGLMRRERADRKLVPEPVRLSAYRIAEEALTNAVKHARASRVTICLDLLPRELLRLTVRDDGQGFDSRSASAGLGIVAMQDYAAVMGGKCVVQGAPGQGTEVTATLPLVRHGAASPERARS